MKVIIEATAVTMKSLGHTSSLAEALHDKWVSAVAHFPMETKNNGNKGLP